MNYANTVHFYSPNYANPVWAFCLSLSLQLSFNSTHRTLFLSSLSCCVHPIVVVRYSLQKKVVRSRFFEVLSVPAQWYIVSSMVEKYPQLRPLSFFSGSIVAVVPLISPTGGLDALPCRGLCKYN